MGDRMDVDPERIDNAGGGIRASAQRLKSEWTAFQQELAGHGEPWGNDDLGSWLGMLYQGAYELAADCFQDNTEAIDDHGQGVNAMAADYRGAEQKTTDQ